MTTNSQPTGHLDLCPPVRNRYFYGKLLDVFNFELEQNYFNEKRWLLNRLVSGYGVVCGLGVQLCADKQSIGVLPGLAIDKCGREILVCTQSDPYPLPPPQAPASGSAPAAIASSSATAKDCCDGAYVHVSICFHECPSDPVPSLGGDCDSQPLCSPGAIRERYKIELGEGKLSQAATTSRIQDVISSGLINYNALANYVTNPCPCPPDDCCIPLANIRIPGQGQSYDQSDIDISARPIVFTNDLLYELIIAVMNQGQSQTRGRKL